MLYVCLHVNKFTNLPPSLDEVTVVLGIDRHLNLDNIVLERKRGGRERRKGQSTREGVVAKKEEGQLDVVRAPSMHSDIILHHCIVSSICTVTSKYYRSVHSPICMVE